jgi:hypothetical protein
LSSESDQADGVKSFQKDNQHPENWDFCLKSKQSATFGI